MKATPLRDIFTSASRDPAVKYGPLLLGVRAATADKGKKSVKRTPPIHFPPRIHPDNTAPMW